MCNEHTWYFVRIIKSDGDAISTLNNYSHEIRYKQESIPGTVWCLIQGASLVVSFDIVTMGLPRHCQWCGTKLDSKNTLVL